MKIDVFQELWRFNRACDEAITALGKLRQYPGFRRKEIERLAGLSKENRAAANSYLAGAIEMAETEEAGRRYGNRRRREKQEDESA